MDDREYVVTPEIEVLDYREGNGDEEIDVPLEIFISRLQKALDTIPAEHRASARFHIWATGDYAHAYVDVRYTRPENDEERAARVARDDEYRARGEAEERAYYERLKAKFG